MTSNPINPSNDRIAGFCQAVMWKSRVTTQTGGDDSPTDSYVLKGVQSVGVSRDVNREAFIDIGRYGRQWGKYGKTLYTINVSRVLSKSSDFFYNQTNSGLTSNAESNYLNAHILSVVSDQTIGVDGMPVNGTDRGLRNYDITLIYGRDDISYVGKTPSTGDPNINHQTYRCCLLTSISYTLSVDGSVTEDLTFVTTVYTQNEETNPANWTYLNKNDTTAVAAWDTAGEGHPGGFEHSRPSDPGSPPPEPPYSLFGFESTLKRQDILTEECDFPLEVIEAFEIQDRTQGIPGRGQVPILGIQQIEISIDIAYNDLVDIGKWAGSVGDRAEVNKFRQVELPVGVSCTFTGVVGAQYFSKLEFNTESANPVGQNHEVTDTYHTAGNYGAENKNAVSTDANNELHIEQYEADREIKIVARGIDPAGGTAYEKWQWNLGKRNYISSFEVTGGDAEGGNVEVSMSFQNDWSEFFLFKNTDVLDFKAPALESAP